MKFSTPLRLGSVSALMILLAACGGGDDGADLSSSRNELSAADVDAALGPSDQSGITDVGTENLSNDVMGGEAEANTTANADTEPEEQE